MQTPDPSFEKLLESFLALAGHNPGEAAGSTGFEFECGAHNVAVFPAGDSRLVVEAEAAVLLPAEAANAALLMAIHRLNEAARAEHGWVATIDGGDRVLVSKVLPLHGTDAVALQDAVTTALTLAGSLAGLVAHAAGSEATPSGEETQAPQPPPGTFA
jgi:hypothetical protein